MGRSSPTYTTTEYAKMIIQFSAVPYTSEYFLASTGSVYALTTGCYFPQAGIGRNMAANRAAISVENANMRYKMNGSAPATSCGHLLVDGSYMTLDDVSQMINLRMMNESGIATAYIHITYFEG